MVWQHTKFYEDTGTRISDSVNDACSAQKCLLLWFYVGIDASKWILRCFHSQIFYVHIIWIVWIEIFNACVFHGERGEWKVFHSILLKDERGVVCKCIEVLRAWWFDYQCLCASQKKMILKLLLRGKYSVCKLPWHNLDIKSFKSVIFYKFSFSSLLNLWISESHKRR